MNENWETTVQNLIVIFKGALTNLIPWLEKAMIKWKSGESYDDFENISIALYENIVSTSLYSEHSNQPPLAKYLYAYDDYSSVDFIGVKDNNYRGRLFAFVSFQSINLPLDRVKVVELDPEYKAIGVKYLNANGVDYFFARGVNGDKKFIEQINVIL